MAKHHAKRIRGIHTRYVLILLNLALFGGLVWAYDHTTLARQQSDGDAAVLAAMMGGGEPELLTPPTVLGGR